ncbi:transposase [uncultured Thiodictyon sp.]|uniref:transposase n=1 Tax=uncultured Thiodictyon sp. TaxID=1846217 RepID=UPI0025F64205|nr:transposase [uncultured Thiodictyon sp.]
MPAEIRPRGSMRLKGYDYAQAGAYFVTICVQDRLCLFGEVISGLFVSNQFGALVAQAWNDLPNHYPHVSLDQFVVMPNHVHGIIILTDVGAGLKPAPTAIGLNPAPSKRHALPEIIRALKTFSARRINEIRQSPGISVWQRNYYEHVIRSEADYTRIAEYIINNPCRWSEDSLHPANAPLVDTGVIGEGFKPARVQRNADGGAGLKPDCYRDAGVGAGLKSNDHLDVGVGAGLKPAPTKRDKYLNLNICRGRSISIKPFNY